MKGLTLSPPGSARWLLRHELRMVWRGLGKPEILLALAALASLALHVVAWMFLRLWPAGSVPPAAVFLIGVVVWVCGFLMTAQAIWQSVEAWFDRGDLDLLLSSPLPVRNVFMARSLAVAASVVSLYLLLLAPLANVGLFTGHAELLALYPALAALALAATGLGTALTLMLVRLLGARRARTAAQVLGSLMGAALILLPQLPNVLSAEHSRALVQQLLHWGMPGGPLAADSPLWWPARALIGEPLPLLALVAVGAGSFLLVVRLAHRRFLAGTQASVTGSGRRAATPRAHAVRFRGGLRRNLLVKEWRLILRDPRLITQTLMQVVGLVPLVAISLHHGMSSMLMPAIVFLATTLADGLAWIVVAAEDAPDLLRSSPRPPALLRRIKVAAALLPVWLLLSPLLAVLPDASLQASLAFLFCVLGGTLSAGMVQLWYPTQGRRADMKRRMQGHGALGLLASWVAIAWTATAYALLAAPRYAPLALAGAALGLATVWWMGRSRREQMA